MRSSAASVSLQLRARSSRNRSPWNTALGAGRNCRLGSPKWCARGMKKLPNPRLPLRATDGDGARAGGLRQPAADDLRLSYTR